MRSIGKSNRENQSEALEKATQHKACGIAIYQYKGLTAQSRFLSAVKSKFVFLLPQKPPPDTSGANLPFAPDGCKRGKWKEGIRS
jgi:hypothetical protein